MKDKKLTDDKSVNGGALPLDQGGGTNPKESPPKSDVPEKEDRPDIPTSKEEVTEKIAVAADENKAEKDSDTPQITLNQVRELLAAKDYEAITKYVEEGVLTALPTHMVIQDAHSVKQIRTEYEAMTKAIGIIAVRLPLLREGFSHVIQYFVPENAEDEEQMVTKILQDIDEGKVINVMIAQLPILGKLVNVLQRILPIATGIVAATSPDLSPKLAMLSGILEKAKEAKTENAVAELLSMPLVANFINASTPVMGAFGEDFWKENSKIGEVLFHSEHPHIQTFVKEMLAIGDMFTPDFSETAAEKPSEDGEEG